MANKQDSTATGEAQPRPTPPRRNGWGVYQQWLADNEADMREMARWQR